ncbi:ergothioneine biosynthesis protein 1-like isoform X2 [Pomacea canaliculata]|nr:ergothioneine biosynthesis protein 1-like isoform X2 [Pomacea canaliculata]
MSWDDTENYRMGGGYKWPSVDDVVEYRRNVRNIILKLIADTTLVLPITMDTPWWALMMGMEHERIHLETSSVLLRQLPLHLVQKPPGWVYAPSSSGSLSVLENKMVQVSGGKVTLGKPKDFPSYGWDNEYGEVTARVVPFEASRYLVTNREYLEFVLAGGYIQQEFWTTEGWNWVQYRQAKHPTFWVCHEGCKSGCGADLASYSHCNLSNSMNCDTEGQVKQDDSWISEGTSTPDNKSQYRYRAIFDVLAMPWNWPVDVNYHEAKAFCRWKGPGFRLPAEAEHHLMRGPQMPSSQGPICDIIFQKDTRANLNLQYGSSTPVDMFPPTKAGFFDVFGNVWEWTEDHFNGLSNFQTHYLYDDFSSPCFDGKHNIIMGGSWISTGDEASRFARFAFRRHFYQHLGFRLVKTLVEGTPVLPICMVDTEVFVLGSGMSEKSQMAIENAEIQSVPTVNVNYLYDSTMPLQGILELEFGFRDSLPATYANLAASLARSYNIPMTTALHIGSATGCAAFELSKHFEQVLGVECCARLINAALKLQEGKTLTYKDGKEVTLDPTVNSQKVIFKQLTWLPNEVKQHNMVLVSFLHRIQNPKAWLARLWEITSPSGIVMIISSDGSWTKENLWEHLGHKFHCTDAQSFFYSSPAGQASASFTVWKHK